MIARSLFYLCLAYIFYMAVFVIPAQPASGHAAGRQGRAAPDADCGVAVMWLAAWGLRR
jgi:hypothetical protein